MTTGPVPARRLWIGTYPVAGQGTPTGSGEGIWTVTLDVGSGLLSEPRQVATTPAPSFLAHGPRGGVLYAVNEQAEGSLTAFAVAGDALRELGRVASGGQDPCHLLVLERPTAALVANYSSGSLALIPLGPDGEPRPAPGDPCVLHGSGPDAERQATSHAHYLLATPDPEVVLVVDLGADQLRRLRIDPDRGLLDSGIAVAFPPGTGPRHAVFSADGDRLFVLGELDGQVHTVAWDATTSTGTLLDSTAAHPAELGTAQLAHLVRTDTGLVVGSRGADVLAVHRFIEDGLPRLDRVLPLPGAWPRHHAVVDGWLVVAQQNGGGVITMDRDGTVRGRAEIPSPACILADRRMDGRAG